MTSCVVIGFIQGGGCYDALIQSFDQWFTIFLACDPIKEAKSIYDPLAPGTDISICCLYTVSGCDLEHFNQRVHHLKLPSSFSVSFSCL